ncbi:MAG: calmodulin-binding protein [Pirellulaceae bacterium]
MSGRFVPALLCALVVGLCLSCSQAQAQERGYGRSYGGDYSIRDWERFYHYPYVYYPQNYWGNEYYRSAESLYYRYPSEMRIPVYNKKWYNYYPTGRRYHSGHQFILDVF